MFTAVRAVGAGGATFVVVLLAKPGLEVAVHLPRRHEGPFSGGRERVFVRGPSFVQMIYRARNKCLQNVISTTQAGPGRLV